MDTLNNSFYEHNIKNNNFICWIKKQTHNYFNYTDHEEGGIITFNLDNIDNPYELTLTNYYNPSNGFILFPEEMLNNIKPNQIMWHTHNTDRNFKFEPPSGPDILILMDILKEKSKFIIGIAIQNNGFWIYKLTRDFNQKQKENFKHGRKIVDWIFNTIDDIFANPDPNTINKYHPDDLAEYDINKIETIQDYKNIINRVFNELIYVDFIPFDIYI